jgi:hypothetical protein
LLLALWASAGPLWPARAADLRETPTEYQLKAVFLFNFAQFIEWPPATFPDPKAPLVIGVLGDDPFGASLDETVRDEMIGQRKLVVERYRRVEEITRCHILFISQSEAGRLKPILAQLRGRNTLTVCDTPGYALRGVMIRFVTDKNKIRLRINLEAAKAAGLVISSKLLRPAEIVTSDSP